MVQLLASFTPLLTLATAALAACPMQQLVERGQVPENVAARYFRGEGLEIPAPKAVVARDEGRQDGDHKDP